MFDDRQRAQSEPHRKCYRDGDGGLHPKRGKYDENPRCQRGGCHVEFRSKYDGGLSGENVAEHATETRGKYPHNRSRQGRDAGASEN